MEISFLSASRQESIAELREEFQSRLAESDRKVSRVTVAQETRVDALDSAVKGLADTMREEIDHLRNSIPEHAALCGLMHKVFACKHPSFEWAVQSCAEVLCLLVPFLPCPSGYVFLVCHVVSAFHAVVFSDTVVLV